MTKILTFIALRIIIFFLLLIKFYQQIFFCTDNRESFVQMLMILYKTALYGKIKKTISKKYFLI
jgi:hypothetical protein